MGDAPTKWKFTGASPGAPPPPRYAACLACRARKTRCHGVPGETCAGCRKRGVACEWRSPARTVAGSARSSPNSSPSPLFPAPAQLADSDDPRLDSAVLPLLFSSFFASLALPVLSEGLFRVFAGSARSGALPRIYGHPAVRLVMLWTGTQTLLGQGLAIPLSKDLSAAEVCLRLRKLVHRTLVDQMSRISAAATFQRITSGNDAVQGATDPDDVAVLLAVILALRPLCELGLDGASRSLRRAFLNLVFSSGLLRHMSRRGWEAGQTVPVSGLCIEQTLLTLVWAAVVGDLGDSFSVPGAACALLVDAADPSGSEGASPIIGTSEVAGLPFPMSSAALGELMAPLDPFALDSTTCTILARPLTGGQVSLAVEHGSVSELGSLFGLGIPVVSFAVSELLDRSLSLVRRARALGLAMTDLAVIEDSLQEVTVHDSWEFDGRLSSTELWPVARALVNERIKLLSASRTVFATMPPDLVPFDEAGDLRAVSILAARQLGDMRGELWVHLLFLRYSTLVLLAPAPGSSAGGPNGQRYMHTPALAAAIGHSITIGSYAASLLKLMSAPSVFRSGMAPSRPVAPPFLAQTFAGTAAVSSALIEWCRAELPAEAIGDGLLAPLLAGADSCKAIVQMLGP
ncbi:hypothetical protein DFJ74DRAFT_653495 [Hyaloraphidium curvatum]|nr:hypothetical protein DFJ74DRAFT_653495 [Hyaloraphidium curvatum]